MYGWRAYWDCLQKNLSFRQSSSVIQMSIKWRWRWWRITSPRIDQHFIHLIEMSVFCLISNKVILRVCFIIDGVVYHNIIYTYIHVMMWKYVYAHEETQMKFIGGRNMLLLNRKRGKRYRCTMPVCQSRII